MRVSRCFLVVALALAGVLTACSTPEELAVADANLTLVEDLRIGLSHGPEEYLFGRIGGIVQHDDGTVSILDAQVPVIRHYEPSGLYVHAIGREGQGPGEYSDTIHGMVGLPDDGLAVWDLGNQRVSIFAPDGTFARSFAIDAGAWTSSSPLRTDHEGNLYVYTTDHSGPLRDGRFPWVYLKFSPTGDQIGKIAVPDEDAEKPGWAFSTWEGRLRNFTHHTLHALTSGGHLVVGNNAEYRYEVRRDDGTALAVARTWEPVPLEPEEKAEWEAWRQYFDDNARENGRESPGYPPIPDTKPAFMDLHAGEDGTVWVRRYARARERHDRPPRAPDDLRPSLNWWQPIILDAFDEAGEFLGTIELPNETRVVAFHRDWMWTVQPNKDDEPVAVRYRIEGSR